MTMIYVVNHSISDPNAFWGVLSQNPALPEGFEVCSVLPGTDVTQAVCIWKAPGQRALEELISSTVGHCSSNTFMEVNVANAIGLPG